LLAADVRKARLRKLKTVFYFVYAGHGNTKKQTSYITLEDQRLSGPTLRTLINKVGPPRTRTSSLLHVIPIFSLIHAVQVDDDGDYAGIRNSSRSFRSRGLLLSTTSAKKKS
jgi:hypothetical protein